MINFIHNPDRIRIDTDIIINEDDKRIVVPVVIYIKIQNLEEKHQSKLWRISYNLFNKTFIVNKNIKKTKKPWWNFW